MTPAQIAELRRLAEAATPGRGLAGRCRWQTGWRKTAWTHSAQRRWYAVPRRR